MQHDYPGQGSDLSRRVFLKNSAVVAAIAAIDTKPLYKVKGENERLVGIQIGPESFVDEGIEQLLDTLQKKGEVNTLFLTAFTYGGGFAGRVSPGRAFPDHGKPLSNGNFFHGGYFATPHAQFYQHTVLKHTQAPDHGGRDIIAEVLPAAISSKPIRLIPISDQSSTTPAWQCKPISSGPSPTTTAPVSGTPILFATSGPPYSRAYLWRNSCG